jgi:hypothetical protein
MAKPTAITSGVQTFPASVPRTVQLDGTSSTCHAGRTITAYKWSVIEVPEGSTAVLSNANVATPTITLDRAGTYLFVLEVTDSEGEKSDTDVRTMPASAYAALQVPTAAMGFLIPAWQQRFCSRQVQRNWHALEAEIIAIRGRLDALEG